MDTFKSQTKELMEPHFYTVNLDWNTERKGILCSPELNLATTTGSTCLEVATPPEFPKGISGIWSPEHLFTAAVNSCLMTTFLAIAENSQLAFSQFSCNAKGKLEQVEGKFMMTEVFLEVALTIDNEDQRERAERVVQKAEAACLISNSIKSHVHLNTQISIATA